MEKRLAKKVLLIGWDAADWKVINPLIDDGKMPVLERFVNEGVMGNLAILNPILSPMLWTSIATEMRTFKHGVYGFTELDPNTGNVRPVTNTTREVKALEVDLSQNPNFAETYHRLAYIYEHQLDNPDWAEHHRGQAKEIRQRRREARLAASADAPSVPKPREEMPPTPVKPVPALAPQPAPQPVPKVPSPATAAPATDLSPTKATLDGDDEFITVVSGLPRSGTSMMMQMLHASGHPCLADGQREADTDNPRGYFEYEKVKQLRRDCSWLPEAKGKAVKIIVQLLPFLPPQHNYRVVFMERDIDEVLASQRRMLDRQGRQGGALSDERLRQVFERQVSQVKQMLAARNIPTLYVEHKDAFQRPMEIAEQVRNFLGGDLDAQAMAGVVDSDLYRQRRQ